MFYNNFKKRQVKSVVLGKKKKKKITKKKKKKKNITKKKVNSNFVKRFFFFLLLNKFKNKTFFYKGEKIIYVVIFSYKFQLLSDRYWETENINVFLFVIFFVILTKCINFLLICGIWPLLHAHWLICHKTQLIFVFISSRLRPATMRPVSYMSFVGVLMIYEHCTI